MTIGRKLAVLGTKLRTEQLATDVRGISCARHGRVSSSR